MSIENNVKSIFGRALEIESAEERNAYLAETCADDPQLRQEVEKLVASLESAGSFMDGPALDPPATVDGPSIGENVGAQIGHYKLLQKIGEGGFGIVFMSEQHKPVRRKVALKLIKPGMDTKEIIGRFEAERQALAMMDHPNIAKVFDAGTTDSGRPYFVMELVKGGSS